MSKQPHNNAYTLGFVAIMALICAAMLSFAADSLRERQELNKQLDVKRNILKAFQILTDDKDAAKADAMKVWSKAPNAEINAWYTEHIEERAVTIKGELATLKEGEEPFGLDAERELKAASPANGQLVNDKGELAADDSGRYPLFVLKDPNDATKPLAYAVPIWGKGLWSTLYGYLALESNLDNVRGITFYKHGETPGLGGEVENAKWQAQWGEKKILSENHALVSVKVAKGPAAEKYQGEELKHYVDGLSGATMTSRGVSTFVEHNLMIYEAYFNKLRKGE